MCMTFSVRGPRLAEKRLLLRTFKPGPELSWHGARAPWCEAAGRVAANSCKPAATPQEQLREPERDLQHDAGAPQRRLEVDRGRCAGTFRCAQHPYSHPFTSHHPSLVPTGFHAAEAQTDRVGAGADLIGRLKEELNQLGDASGQKGEALLVGERQEARR